MNYEPALNLVASNQKFLIVQAGNPDGDSLASALAFEQILGQMGKDCQLYCNIDVPTNLKYIPGWDRVTAEIDTNFDAAIVVDASTPALLNALRSEHGDVFKDKPLMVVDHHQTEDSLECDVAIIDPKAISTGQLIYNLAQNCKWPIDTTTGELIAIGILSDSLGLTSQGLDHNPEPIHILGQLVDIGVSLADINSRRLDSLKISLAIMQLKTALAQNVQTHYNGQIVSLDVDQATNKDFAGNYNPTVILDEYRYVEGVEIGLGFKTYGNLGQINKITVRIRCYGQKTIARDLAEAFGGGGHIYASGAKWEGSNLDFSHIKQQVIDKAIQLLEIF